MMKLTDRFQSLYIHYLSRLVLFSVKRRFFVIVLTLLTALSCLAYARFHLPINSDQENLVSRDNIFLKREEVLSQAFPQQTHTIIAIISGDNQWRVGQKTEQIANAIKARGDLFKNVFYPQGMDFFHKNGLLYLDEDMLADFVDGLAQAQPIMAELARNPNLIGLFDIIGEGLNQQDSPESQDLPESFDLIIGKLAEAIFDYEAGRPLHDVWAEAFPNWHVGAQNDDGGGGDNAKNAQPSALQIIVIQPRLEFSNFLSGQKSILALRQIAQELKLPEAGVTMELTGREPLTYDELQSIIINIEIAAVISTIAILIILGIGIGSWRMIGMIMYTLFIGMCWSIGWAAISTGELNMISAAFIVLFLGLGVDFGIHIALRYREEYNSVRNPHQSFLATVQGAGGAISLCAFATAIGFLSFVPTDYFALRDLGIIAGGSMFLAMLASWTLLPALLTFLGDKDLIITPQTKPNKISLFSVRFYEWIRIYFRPISWSAVALGIIAIPLAMRMHFDHSALVIKDPYSESIIALKKLQKEGLYTDYTASLLVKDRQSAYEKAHQLSQLPLVNKVETHDNFVPQNQPDKLALIEEAAFFMNAVLTTKPNPKKADDPAFKKASEKLLAILNKKTNLSKQQMLLADALKSFLESSSQSPAQSKPQSFTGLNQALMGDYPERIKRLSQSLEAEIFEFDDLPENVKAQSQSADGRIKLTIYPKEDMTDPQALKEFVKVMTSQNELIGGRPLVEYAVGEITINAFITSLLLALIFISLILLTSLRSVKDMILVLLPIALAGVWTLAICVWLDIAFNFVNVLLLPLLLGLGVANGIHILSRSNQKQNIREVMSSSTPVAVFLSNSTTLASFGSVSIASHKGLQSMGITLTIAMILMMICALIVLPAIIAYTRRNLPSEQLN